jgi:hypothetical protein
MYLCRIHIDGDGYKRGQNTAYEDNGLVKKMATTILSAGHRVSIKSTRDPSA